MKEPFSDLADHFDVPTNPLYAARDRLLAAGTPIIDLVSGNVNAQGIQFPPSVLETALLEASRLAVTYKPDPLGQFAAREAIAQWYGAQGVPMTADRLVLTPGTSLSYWYAFRALAAAGDEILCPHPTYPLFDAIATLASVRLVPYHLQRSTRWSIDVASIERTITSRTKAIVVVTPHNPTGSVMTSGEWEALEGLAARRDLAIISDEVFSPFCWTGASFPRPRGMAPLVVMLNGFSKLLALPGFKIGWMALSGRSDRIATFRKLLEMVSDTFLPVNEIAQAAVPSLLSRGAAFAESYVAAMRERTTRAFGVAKDLGFEAVAPEGGFYLPLRLREGIDEEAVALQMLEASHVLTHPGFFYDFSEPHLVVTTVNAPEEFERGMRALQEAIKAF